MGFDFAKVAEEMKKKAAEHFLKVLGDAKHEMGAEGKDIAIDRAAVMRQHGDNLNLGGISFPSEEIKDRFLEIVKRRMR